MSGCKLLSSTRRLALILGLCVTLHSHSLLTAGCDQGRDCCNCKDSTDCDKFSGSCQSGCKVSSPKAADPKAFFRGKTLKVEKNLGNKTIKWKQGSFVGIGGDRSQTYAECIYSTEGCCAVTVFVQLSYCGGGRPPAEITVAGNLQYGMTGGKFFMVYHDKEQKPYQARFDPSTRQELKLIGIPISTNWFMGEYLENF